MIVGSDSTEISPEAERPLPPDQTRHFGVVREKRTGVPAVSLRNRLRPAGLAE